MIYDLANMDLILYLITHAIERNIMLNTQMPVLDSGADVLHSHSFP